MSGAGHGRAGTGVKQAAHVLRVGNSPRGHHRRPAENLFGVPEGTYEPTVADGFYLLLAPLHPGPHTISFGGTGEFLGAPFAQDITYHLVVG